MTIPRAALVLTAGLGTRLRPLTDVRAKPAIPVAGEAMIRRIIGWLTRNGVRDIVLNLHHLPETISGAVGDGSDLSARVRYSWEQPLVLGAAGGPRQALPLLDTRTFLLLNGDTLTDVDLAALANSHATSGALVTMALVPNHEPDRYGGVRLDSDGRALGFAPRGNAAGSYHFVGVQIVEAEAFSALPAGQPARSVGGLYEELIATQPGSIRGVVCDAAFWDVGTAADYWSTSWFFADREKHAGVISGRRVSVAPTARVSRSILWDDIEVSRDAVIEDCVVTDGVRVPAGARYLRAILRRGPDGTVLTSPLLI
jgi:NDP-sugar pyrophosphorylase family protein